MIGKDFPIAEYYKKYIIDAETVSRSGQWWTAVLLINDPRKGKPFVSVYRWQYKDSGWKIRNRFHFRDINQAKNILSVVNSFIAKIESSS